MAAHRWDIVEVYSNATGTVQFVELLLEGGTNETFFNGRTLTAANGVDANRVFTFGANLPHATAPGDSLLIATQGFALLGTVTPDFILPDGFLFVAGGTLNFANFDTISHGSFPTDATRSLGTNGLGGFVEQTATPRNFNDVEGSIPLPGINGTEGNDTVLGTSGNDTLNGLGGNDSLNGDAGNDTLNGHDGNDTLNGGAGADTMAGGAGADIYYINKVGDAVIEAPGEGTDLIYTSISYTLADNAENLRIVGGGAINITGNALDNLLYTGTGNNIIDGGDGTDTLTFAAMASGVNVSLVLKGPQATGGSGADTLLNIENLVGSSYNDTVGGNADDNTLDGGSGTDTASYALASTGVVASLATRTATGQGNDSLLRFENLQGGDFNDVLTGSTVANLLQGGAGNDTVKGSSGNDMLEGGDGNDWLVGGTGSDSLTGGQGADRFDFNLATETGTTDATSDIVADFNSAQGDKIDLSTIDADTTLAGNQAFTFLGAAALTGAGQVRYDAGTGMLYGSTDADASAEFAVRLVGLPALVAGDVIF